MYIFIILHTYYDQECLKKIITILQLHEKKSVIFLQSGGLTWLTGCLAGSLTSLTLLILACAGKQSHSTNGRGGGGGGTSAIRHYPDNANKYKASAAVATVSRLDLADGATVVVL